MAKEIVHYNMDDIESKGANINLIWGERSNGKSYQVKHKRAIFKYLYGIDKNHVSSYKDKNKIIENMIIRHSRFVLLRRWQEEIKTDKIEKYFADVDVAKITDNKYNCIVMYKKTLYLASYDFENAKAVKGEIIGYVMSLSTEQNYAGTSYLDVTDIIFEEFMSRSSYLANEPDKLMNLYSTIDRKRGTTRLWLVGNTISRICPYLTEWGLMNIITRQKQGDIDTLWVGTGDYDEDGKEIEVKIAIEYCKSTGNSSFVIGKHKNMLNKGEWQSDPQPHLPKSRKCYKLLYRIGFMYQSFKFIGEYLKDTESKERVWFIYPYDINKDFKDKMLVFSDVVKQSPYWQRNIYDLSIKNDKLKNLCKTFKENNIFYASDLIGTDFKQVIDFEIRR